MATFTPPHHLDYSLPLTAIEEEMRMDSLGIRFLCHNRCFHYLIPLELCDEADRATASPARHVLFSYLYHPVTKVITRCQKTLITDEGTWERRAREIGTLLSQEDVAQFLWD